MKATEFRLLQYQLLLEINAKLIQVEEQEDKDKIEDGLILLANDVKKAGGSKQFGKQSIKELFARFYELCGEKDHDQMASQKIEKKILAQVPQMSGKWFECQ